MENPFNKMSVNMLLNSRRHCCFFCYTSWEGGAEPTSWSCNKKDRELLCRRFFILFQRHLKIREDDGLWKEFLRVSDKRNIPSSPCEDCFKLLNSFCELYQQLKILELRVDLQVSKLEHVMRGGAADDSGRIPSGLLEYFTEGNSANDDGGGGRAEDVVEGKVVEGIINAARELIIGKCRDRLMSRSFPKVILHRTAIVHSNVDVVEEHAQKSSSMFSSSPRLETVEAPSLSSSSYPFSTHPQEFKGPMEALPSTFNDEDDPKIEIASTMCVLKEEEEEHVQEEDWDWAGDGIEDGMVMSCLGGVNKMPDDYCDTTTPPPDSSTTAIGVTTTNSIPTSSYYRVLVNPGLTESDGERDTSPSSSSISSIEDGKMDDDGVEFYSKLDPEENPDFLPHPEPLACIFCERELSSSRAALERHLTTTHTRERPMICRICGSEHSTRRGLLRHLQMSHHHRDPSTANVPIVIGKATDINNIAKRKDKRLNSRSGRNHLIGPEEAEKGTKGTITAEDRHHQIKKNVVVVRSKLWTPSEIILAHGGADSPATHIFRTFDDLPLFPCSAPSCKAKFYSGDSLDQHSKHHHAQFKCHFCSVGKESSAKIALHEMNHHHQQHCGDDEGRAKKDQRLSLFTCARCKFTTTDKSQYLRHHSEVHLQLPRLCWKCPICDVSKKILEKSHRRHRLRALRRHFQRNHDSSDMELNNLARCDLCPAYFRTCRLLDLHKRRAHSTAPPPPALFKCGDCKKTFKFRQSLKTHRHKWHVKEEDLKFPCPAEGCTRSFEALVELQTHQKIIHNRSDNPKVVCPSCGKLFWKRRLGAHIMMVHKKNPTAVAASPKVFVCDQCGVSFKSKPTLEQHQFSHSGPSSWKYTCSICGKKCYGKSSLEGHIRTHTKEKPFICQVCGEAYAHRHNLRAHINKNHSDVMEDKAKPVVRKVISSKRGRKVEHVFDTSVKL